MNSDAYLRQRQWASERGLFLDKAIERKQVNGVFGMYTSRDIPANTVVASFPVKNLLKPQKLVKFAPEHDNDDLNYVLAASRELAKGDQSRFTGIFDGFELLEDMRSYSTTFITEPELQLLKSFHPTAYTWIVGANQNSQKVVDAILAQDPTLTRETILTVYLNHKSRSVRNIGTVPVLDQFNHSDRHGNPKTVQDGRVCVRTKVDYAAGDQVFITYGRKDLLQHAIHYNYFDPNGTHFIEPARRIFAPVSDQPEQGSYGKLRQKYPLQLVPHQGNNFYFLDDHNALMTECAPTPYLLDYLIDMIRTGQTQPVPTLNLLGSVLRSYLHLLDMLATNNRRSAVQRSDLPPRLHRFHDLLAKEEQMIHANRNWVIEHVA